MEAHKLTEEETNTLKKKARDILSVCRRDILSKYPFIGSIALRMDMVPVRDVRVRTACTDGNSVYFDIAFLSSLSREEQQFVLAHEIWHAVLLHLVRRHNRIPQLFNIATDKEVNYLLKQDGFVPPADLCFPEGDEVGKCAEEIYEMLLKKMPKMPKQSKLPNMGGAGGTGGIGGGNNKSTGNQQGKSNQPNKNKTGNDNNKGNGNEDGTLTGQFDKHVYDGENANDDKSGNDAEGNGQPNGFAITDKYGEVGLDSDFQPKVSKNFADKMRETIISEAQRIEKMKGSLPAHIKSLVERISTPEVKWQEVLARFVTRCYNGGRRQWIPPNRRHVYHDVYIQSRQADKIRIACIIDTSGSTMGDRTKFLSELHGLINSFGLFDLTILDVDAEVNDVRHFTQDDNLDYIIENGEFTMGGGGGTAMSPGFQRILDDQIECDAILCLTDGFIDHIPKNPTGLPTLWIITKDGTEDFCDWGEKIKLKFDDADISEQPQLFAE